MSKRATKNKAAKPGSNIIVSLGQLHRSTGALSALATQPMPIRTSFQMGKLISAINGELKQSESTRVALCERYANKDGEGKPIMIDPTGRRITAGEQGDFEIPADKRPEFDREHEDLLSVEVAIPGEPLLLANLSNVVISPGHLLSLDWLISE